MNLELGKYSFLKVKISGREFKYAFEFENPLVKVNYE